MKAFLLKLWHGFLAGITSPTAVKQEKSLLVTVLVRMLLAVGAGDGLVKLIQALPK